MTVNFTFIERYVRLFGAPTILMILGGLLSLFLPAPAILKGTYIAWLLPLIMGAHLVAIGALAFGLAWFAWAGWQLHRWESGAMAGDCPPCVSLVVQ